MRHARRLVRLYGTRAERAAWACGRAEADLGRNFGAELYEAEVRYLIDHEWARPPRTCCGAGPSDGLHLTGEEAAAVEEYMAERPAKWPARAIAAKARSGCVGCLKSGDDCPTLRRNWKRCWNCGTWQRWWAAIITSAPYRLTLQKRHAERAARPDAVGQDQPDAADGRARRADRAARSGSTAQTSPACRCRSATSRWSTSSSSTIRR